MFLVIFVGKVPLVSKCHNVKCQNVCLTLNEIIKDGENVFNLHCINR